jgi:hypothetical protein
MIIEIALGILLGYILIQSLPLILTLGIWALIISIVLAVVVGGGILFFSNLDMVGELFINAVGIALMIFCVIGTMVSIGYISYFFNPLSKLLKIGERPTLGNEKTKFLQYKEICFDYATAGTKATLLIAVLVIAFLILRSLVKAYI